MTGRAVCGSLTHSRRLKESGPNPPVLLEFAVRARSARRTRVIPLPANLLQYATKDRTAQAGRRRPVAPAPDLPRRFVRATLCPPGNGGVGLRLRLPWNLVNWAGVQAVALGFDRTSHRQDPETEHKLRAIQLLESFEVAPKFHLKPGDFLNQLVSNARHFRSGRSSGRGRPG